MESLESKLENLTPEQRKEVEDFVNFLLSRSGATGSPREPAQQPPAPAPLPIEKIAPPPLIALDPVQDADMLPPPTRRRQPDPAAEETEDTPEAEPAITEIIAGGDDWTTRDYMDYGQFEDQKPTQATMAVKRVREKLGKQESENKPHHILDWID
jgi:hypothetical protein